jgi:hypothetical protein
MLSSLWDYKNSTMKKAMHDDKIDPGTFSIMEPGWWALHAIAITGVYLIGNRLKR